MKIGYARISTTDQGVSMQRDALEAAGYTCIYTDTKSGIRADREGLISALDCARSGDVMVV